MISTKQTQRGFTLLELMIVLIIAMILVTVAIPAYQDYQVKSKYVSAVSQLSADKLAIVDLAIRGGFSFRDLPEDELDHEGIQQHFALADTNHRDYLGHQGGKKGSDNDYMLYQFVDKDEINAPEIAPEMVALAVVIENSGAFTYHCHYYHSAYLWDYEGGDPYVSLMCDAIADRHTSTDPGSEIPGVSDTNTPHINDSSDDSNDPGFANPGSADEGDSAVSPVGDSGAGDGNQPNPASDPGNGNKNKEDCDHGGDKVKNNNGHGNNIDGVDSSNPGNGNKKEDASCTGKKCVDDER